MENKIIILVGKSAVGKGAIENSLVNHGYRRIVTNTTRPPREHEKDGVDYHFCTKEQFNNLVMSGRMIEYRTYNTVHGGRVGQVMEVLTGLERTLDFILR